MVGKSKRTVYRRQKSNFSNFPDTRRAIFSAVLNMYHIFLLFTRIYAWFLELIVAEVIIFSICFSSYEKSSGSPTPRNIISFVVIIGFSPRLWVHFRVEMSVRSAVHRWRQSFPSQLPTQSTSMFRPFKTETVYSPFLFCFSDSPMNFLSFSC